MKKILIIIAFVVIQFAVSSAQTNIVGTTKGDEFVKTGLAGAQFLKIGVGARANAMGGAFGSVADDVSALHYNPAGLSNIEGTSGMFSYTSWFGGFSHNYLGLSVPISDEYRLGFNITSFGVNGITKTTIREQEGDGTTFGINDISFGLTFAGSLTDQFSFGITTKYIHNAFDDVSASSIAFDIGTFYKTGISDINIAFSLHNLGTEPSYSGKSLVGNTGKTKDGDESGQDNQQNARNYEIPASSFDLPIVFRASISKKIKFDSENSLLFAGDFITNSDTPEQVQIGAEYNWTFLSFRAGYFYGNDQMGLSGGFGFNYEVGNDMAARIDYSINPTLSFGLVNRLTVVFDM